MKPGAALVTGGAKRLGRAMALTLAEDGWDVAITWLGSEEEAEDTAAAIRALGRKAALIRADLTIEEETDRVIPAAMEALGQPLTCLINNASIFEFDEISSMTRRGWDRAMESNLRAPVRLTQLFAEAAPEPETDEGRALRLRRGYQHAGSARAKADADVHVLFPRQDGAMGLHADSGTGAGPRYSRDGNRPRPYTPWCEAIRSSFSGPARRDTAAAWLQPGRYYSRTPVHTRITCIDRTGHCA